MFTADVDIFIFPFKQLKGREKKVQSWPCTGSISPHALHTKTSNFPELRATTL